MVKRAQYYDDNIKLISKLSKKIGHIDYLVFQERSLFIDAERKVYYDIFLAWEDYKFNLEEMLYHWNNCIVGLDKIIDTVNECHVDNIKEKTYISVDTNCLSFEFEGFVIATKKLNESAIFDGLIGVLSPINRKKCELAKYNKKDAGGLYWKIELLRSRSAHSTGGKYLKYEDLPARYITMDARVRMANIEGDILHLPTLLINLEKSEYVKQVIQEKILNNHSTKDKDNVFNYLFNTKKEKGDSMLLFPYDFPEFDLNEDFLKLSKEILEYTINMIDIITDDMENRIREKAIEINLDKELVLEGTVENAISFLSCYSD